MKEDENWEAAICPESKRAAVVTRKQAREHARAGEDAATPLVSGRALDPPLWDGGAETRSLMKNPTSKPRRRLSLQLSIRW